MDRFHSRDHKLKGSISNDIKENITYVKQVMKDCNDLVEKQFQIGPKHEISLYIVYMDGCLLYTSPSPRDGLLSRMPSSA